MLNSFVFILSFVRLFVFVCCCFKNALMPPNMMVSYGTVTVATFMPFVSPNLPGALLTTWPNAVPPTYAEFATTVPWLVKVNLPSVCWLAPLVSLVERLFSDQELLSVQDRSNVPPT